MTKCATVGQKLAVDLDDVTESNLTKTVNVFYHDFGRIELRLAKPVRKSHCLRLKSKDQWVKIFCPRFKTFRSVKHCPVEMTNDLC